MQEPQDKPVWSLDQEDPWEEEMATHSSILAWEISWTKESVRVHRVTKSQTWLSAWHINKNNWQLGILKQDFQWPHREMYMVKKIRHSSVFCDFYDPLWFFSNVLLLFFFSLKVSFACRSSSKLHQDTIFDLRSVNYLLIQRMQNPYWKRWKEARNSMSSLTVAMKWQQAFWNR